MECYYGPYKNNKNRDIIIRWDRETDTRRTQSYPRFLMEAELGRQLDKTEHVDHIDNDKHNNELSNFQILTIKENNQKASLNRTGRSTNGPLMLDVYCTGCGILFTKRAAAANVNARLGRADYCSRSCAARAGGQASGRSRRGEN